MELKSKKCHILFGVWLEKMANDIQKWDHLIYITFVQLPLYSRVQDYTPWIIQRRPKTLFIFCSHSYIELPIFIALNVYMIETMVPT
jgi:hypothetical protein